MPVKQNKRTIAKTDCHAIHGVAQINVPSAHSCSTHTASRNTAVIKNITKCCEEFGARAPEPDGLTSKPGSAPYYLLTRGNPSKLPVSGFLPIK